jgi:hypothetical protein
MPMPYRNLGEIVKTLGTVRLSNLKLDMARSNEPDPAPFTRMLKRSEVTDDCVAVNAADITKFSG